MISCLFIHFWECPLDTRGWAGRAKNPYEAVFSQFDILSKISDNDHKETNCGSMKLLNILNLLKKMEIVTLILVISTPILLFFLELPLSVVLEEKIFEKFFSACQFLVTGGFFLFFSVFFVDNILTIVKFPRWRERGAVQLVLSIVLLTLFGVALFPQIVYEGTDLGLKTEIAGFLLSVVYGSLILYLLFVSLPKILLFIKKRPHFGIAAVFIFFFVFAAYASTMMWILSEKIRDLRWENAIEIKGELDSMNEAVNTLWDERAFAKEIRENLTSYLPASYSGQLIVTSFTPLNLESKKARVFFKKERDGQDYYADFSFNNGPRGLYIIRDTEVFAVSQK